MYCKYCGTEIQDNAIICSNCGKNQKEVEVADNVEKKDVFGEMIMLIKSFLSREPMSAIEKSTCCSKGTGIAFILINIILFGFVTCHTLVQLLNHITVGVMDSLGTAISEKIDLTSGISSALSVDVDYGLWIPLSLVMMLFVLLETGVIYLIQKTYSEKVVNLWDIVNGVAVSGIPIIVGLLLSLLFGAMYPPLILCMFVATVIIHSLFLYYVVKQLVSSDTKPVIQFSVSVLIICLIVTLVGCKVISYATSELMYELINTIKSTMGDLSNGNIWNLLF